MCWILLIFILCSINSKGNENPPFTCDWAIIFIKLNFHSLSIGRANSTTTSTTERNGHNPIDVSQHNGDTNTWRKIRKHVSRPSGCNCPKFSFPAWAQANHFRKGQGKAERRLSQRGRLVLTEWQLALESERLRLKSWLQLTNHMTLDIPSQGCQRSKGDVCTVPSTVSICCFHFPPAEVLIQKQINNQILNKWLLALGSPQC